MYRSRIVVCGLGECIGLGFDQKKNISQHERDSILAVSDLPGANVVGKADEGFASRKGLLENSVSRTLWINSK